jgi:hypothetical protein
MIESSFGFFLNENSEIERRNENDPKIDRLSARPAIAAARVIDSAAHPTALLYEWTISRPVFISN